MKLKLKMIAIATAMVSLAGTASAALTSGTTQNNGSFSLLAVDTTTQNWYIRDLGFLINDFLPTGLTTTIADANQGNASGVLPAVSGNKTPNDGLTIAGASAGIPGATIQANFSDAAFSTWLGAQSAGGSNVVWMVGAYDNHRNSLSAASGNTSRLIASSTNAAETFLNSNVTAFTSNSAWGGNFNFFGSATLSATGTGMNINAQTGFGSGADTAAVGQTANLYYASRAAGSTVDGNSATIVKYGNDTAVATVKLEADGDFIYSLAPAQVAAVPLPAAVWMMGAGLMSLVGAARRRRAQAQA